MMAKKLHAKCACQNCGTRIEFPLELTDSTITCPHCHEITPLLSHPTAEQILNAFENGISRPLMSPLYRAGLFCVTIMMILLPLTYIALITAAIGSMIYFAIHARFLVDSFNGGFLLYLFRLMLYGAPLFAGTVLVFFMVKPLFARRVKDPDPLTLDPESETTLFAFIGKICEIVGAPMPQRIDLDCQLNAAATFRLGALSLFENDMVLTIGLPLVAGVNMQEFAGIIAHEFGHLTQGTGMSLSYIIRSINEWFARVVYERDVWDVWLETWAEETDDWRAILVTNAARFAVWLSRSILKSLMYLGHGVCCFLMRQMEYDADKYMFKVAGTATFEQTTKRLTVLGQAYRQSYQAMRQAWNSHRELPEDFPAFLTQMETRISAKDRTGIEDRVGLSHTGLLDTHPSAGDRIRRARQAGEPGVFHLQLPASQLFADFASVSKAASRLHYTDNLGLKFDATSLRPIDDLHIDAAE